jgi:hypothetical protein
MGDDEPLPPTDGPIRFFVPSSQSLCHIVRRRLGDRRQQPIQCLHSPMRARSDKLLTSFVWEALSLNDWHVYKANHGK